MQEVFKLPYEMYIWGENYSLVTKALVGLYVNMKVHNSVNKLSHLLDRKSICEKYGFYISDPTRRKRKQWKETKERQKTKYKPRTHYDEPEDIKLKTHFSQAKQQVQCWLCGKHGHVASSCPEHKNSKMTKGNLFEQKAKEAQQKANAQQLALRSHCNRCGANDHQTNQCPHHPFVKREEVHLMQQGCCSDSTESSSFSENEILLHQKCSCNNPNFCSCKSSSKSELESDNTAPIREKSKVCMYNSIGNQEA